MNIPRTRLRSLARWFLGILALSAVFLLLTYLGWYQKAGRVQTLTLLAILAGGVLLWRFRERLKAAEPAVLFVLFAGLMLRFGYALYTPTTLRFHDLAPIDIRATGHAGYVLNLFLTGSLPPGNAFQFAQPPLYYALSALCMKLYQLGSGLGNAVELFEAARLPSLLASCGALLVSWQIGRELHFKGKPMLRLLAVCAFLPNHFLLAGRANPDSLAVFFIYLIVWYALRWQRQQGWHNTLVLALAFGLGMMTKMTVAVLALPVGVLMAAVFFRRCVRGGEWRILWRLAAFLLVAGTLGLWHPIRNAVLYAQPFGYVHEMSLTDPQYIGALSLWQRFGLPNLRTLFSPLYIDFATGTNVFLYTAKTSVFGEFRYDIDLLIPMVLLAVNIVLILLSLVATVRLTAAALRRQDGRWLLLAGLWLAMLGAYLWLNLRYPFCCSMDYRYMVGTSLVGALALAGMEPFRSPKGLVSRGFALATDLSLAVFAAASLVMYTRIA